MKKKYTGILVFILLLSGMTMAQEVQKNFINYQGVARNATNELMANETMVLGIQLKIGSSVASPAYSENHSIVTDSNGVFSLKIGNGDIVNGDYNAIPWGEQATYVTVLINDSEVGTTEMMAVPYALSSGDAKQSAVDVPYDNSGSGLAATNTQQAIDQLVGSGSVDADGDPTNEIQTLSFDAVTNELILSDGGVVTIPSGGTDADADPTNEFQSLNFDSATNELSLSDGNSVTIPSGGTDADADPTNEIQTLSFDAGTNELSLSDGGVVTIPSGGTDADADPTNEFQNLSFDAATNELSLSDGNSVTIPSVGTDADADPTNELQDISLSGTELTISDGSTIDLAPIVPAGGSDDQNLELIGDVLSIEGGTGSVDLSTYRDDADADPSNELQTLSFDAGTNELSLSDGNSVTIPSGGTDADADPTNELQDISLSGTELTISDGSTIDLAPIVPAGGSDDQNLELTGDVLSIEGGTGSVDLSTYRDDADADPTNEIDVTTKSGILLGDGTDMSGLEGTADGQVPKWDTGTNSWVAGTDATGGGSSLWSENATDIYFDTGNVGIGNTSPGVEPGAGKYLTVATGISASNNAFSSIEIQGGQGTGNRPIGRLDFISNSSPGNSAISRIESRTSGFAQFRGDLAFSTKDGATFSTSNLQERMTIKYNGNIGIGITNPATTLDIIGGQWDLNNTQGDFRIGNNSRGLRIGVATGSGPGGGDVRLRAQGGTDRLILGSANEDVITVTPGNAAVNGDLNVTGEVNRPSTGAANMMPVAYGKINSNGAILSGSGNFTVELVSSGRYRLTVNDLSGDYALNAITVATIDRSGTGIQIEENLTTIDIWTFNSDGIYRNARFNFVIYLP